MLTRSSVLVVVGSLGSGKSPVVRAGVLSARLGLSTVVARASLPADFGTWKHLITTPPSDPLETLAVAMPSDNTSLSTSLLLRRLNVTTQDKVNCDPP
jgi:hypothetical protein